MRGINAGYAQPALLDPSSFSNLDYGNHRYCLSAKETMDHMEIKEFNAIPMILEPPALPKARPKPWNCLEFNAFQMILGPPAPPHSTTQSMEMY